jgi:hypothetical protein
MLVTSGKLIFRFIVLTCVVAISACASTGTPNASPTASSPKAVVIDPMATGWGSAKVGARLGDMINMLGDTVPKTREQVAIIARRANAEPFGSAKNPVRADGPQGQQAYIARLRCAGGEAPRVVNRQNIGIGIYGTIGDRYDVACNGQPNQIIVLDMYHDWVENRAVPGFTIEAAYPPPSVSGLSRTQ